VLPFGTGKPLPVYSINGVPHWVARQVGDVLRYGKGGGELVGMISGEWREEFTDADRCVLKGVNLKDFKGLVWVDGKSPSTFAPSLMPLTESGVIIATTLSHKPAGTRMRRWLADEVLPQIMRDGHFLADRKVVSGQIVGQGIWGWSRSRRSRSGCWPRPS
jgi:prophage antirepressor-like protein